MLSYQDYVQSAFLGNIKTSLLASAAAFFLVPAIAVAAEVEAEAAGAAAAPVADGGDIIVSGSRIVQNGFEAPTPVSVVTAAQIEKAAPVNIADYVNQMPALMGSETPRTPKGSVGTGNAGANYLNLRNLGSTRTLVLLNGRRLTPTNLFGMSDLNTLPSALVKRVDVVTGGASAAWGSDAVAGVVNFVLDNEFKGFKGQIQGGATTHGDGENYSADLSYGTSFAGDRGHFVISGDYAKSKATSYTKRSWFKGNKILSNPNTSAGQPARLVVPWSSLLGNDNGVIGSGPLAGYFFNDLGQVEGTNFLFPPIGASSGTLGGGSLSAYNRLNDIAKYSNGNVPVERGAVFARMSYDFDDAAKVFLEGSWSKAKASAAISPIWRVGSSAIKVKRDNYFLPTALASAMDVNSLTEVPVNNTLSKLGLSSADSDRETIRLVGGVDGDIGNGWSYGVSYQFGRTDMRLTGNNMPRPARLLKMLDAIDNGSGSPICRDAAEVALGCVAVNPFGNQPVSAAALNYLKGESIQDTEYTQTVLSAVVNGSPISLPAGDVSVAFGAEYRTEKGVATSDAVSQAGGFYAGNYKPFYGKYNVKEVFAEVAVPVFEDSPLGRKFGVNLAGRMTDYSTSGTVSTWKAGATYKPVDDIDLRFTRSRDIRAATLNELFSKGVSSTKIIVDPFRSNASTNFVAFARGNTNLKPEKADTLTAGIVFRPSWFPGFAASVDYYDIKIKGAIATNTEQVIINRCYAGETEFCGLITRDGGGVITGVLVVPFNARSEKARGVDVELSYGTDLGNGRLDLRSMMNYTDKLDIIAEGFTISRAGEVGNNLGAAEGVPTFRAVTSITYSTDTWSLQLKNRFIGKSKMDKQWTSKDINFNKVPAIAYFDIYASRKLKLRDADTEVFLAIDNAFDKDPPVVVNQDNPNVINVGTNAVTYDIMGRAVRVGVRVKM